MALKKKGEVDIQEAFDYLVVCEDIFVKQAFEKGRVKGEKTGFQEGFDLGHKKGSDIASEIYFYQGFAKSWVELKSNDSSEFCKTFQHLLEPCLSSIDSDTVLQLQNIAKHNFQNKQEIDLKTIKALKKLLHLIQNFPEDNPEKLDIGSLLQGIRAKFRHCCALLKIETSNSSTSELNF